MLFLVKNMKSNPIVMMYDVSFSIEKRMVFIVDLYKKRFDMKHLAETLSSEISDFPMYNGLDKLSKPKDISGELSMQLRHYLWELNGEKGFYDMDIEMYHKGMLI